MFYLVRDCMFAPVKLLALFLLVEILDGGLLEFRVLA